METKIVHYILESVNNYTGEFEKLVLDYLECNSPLRMSKMKNCKKADNAAKTRLNQGFLKI